MSKRSLGLVAVGSIAGLALAAAMGPVAQSQVLATPSYVPIGVSSSGSGSTVWFHEPSSRQVLACQTPGPQGAGAPSIQCVASKLPN
jgi:hypothetical protein